MRRFVLVVAAALAALFIATLDLSAPASAGSPDPSSQLRDPSGRPVTAGSTSQQTGRPEGTKTRPASPNAITAAGSGCTFTSSSHYYCHAGAYQNVTSDGAYMSTPVQQPAVGASDHSLAELAVESADGKQIIEIGWRIYGPDGPAPRLFIFHWVNGVGTCYNTGCGYVSNSSTITPGMALTPSSTPVQFAIEYFSGNWWYGYNGTWFGYLPGSIWSGTFTRAGLVQPFGEVSSTSTRPCTDMGNGVIGTSASAVSVTGVGYYNGTSAVNLAKSAPEDSTLYDSAITSTSSFRYGGPGAC